MFFTHSKNEADAIYKSIQAYLQQAKQRQDLIALRGQVDLEDNCQDYPDWKSIND
jgi:hypothetical protein